MRLVGLASLSIATCILCFAACGGDEDANVPPAGADGGSSGNTTSSSGTASSSGSSSSSSSSSSSGDSGGGGDDDDDAGKDGGTDSGTVFVVGDGSLGANCLKDDQCKSKVCAVGQKCVLAPSCRGSKTGTPGVDTCGAAEPGNESCCSSLTLPKTATRTLDKFEITSGRIRAFIESLPNKNLRKFAKDFAAANPTSELGKLVTDFPGYLDTLPNVESSGDTPLSIWLGAFPQDAINRYDGCYVGTDSYGAATYWQTSDVLKPYKIGYGKPPDGKRKYSSDVLDTKPANCMPPVLLATFCAWDGGELARPSDYYEVWGHTQETLGPNEFGASGGKYTKPWTAILKPGDFNWRNGHGLACPIAGWPGCDPNAKDGDVAIFFSFPTGGKPADDDSPEIGAPGRFPKDVTAIKSPDGAGWMDLGGNLLEAAWPKSTTSFKTGTQNFCNTAAPVDSADPSYCDRDLAAGGGEPAEARPGSLLFKGQAPTVALIGGSFEVHNGYGENYFANATDDESKLKNYAFAAHFQYGKVGGRCARVK